MSWKCPQCGTQNEEPPPCKTCDHFEYGALSLSSPDTGKELKINLDTDLGQRSLRALNPDDAKFAAETQFSLIRCSRKTGHGFDGWGVKHFKDAKNPTFYDGADISASAAVKLGNGGIISIGKEKLKITVAIITK